MYSYWYQSWTKILRSTWKNFKLLWQCFPCKETGRCYLHAFFNDKSKFFLLRNLESLKGQLLSDVFWWQWCWWHRYVSDFMIVTDLRCLCQNHFLALFGYVRDFINVFNRSPTSQICHQHSWCPTSVTNIDVTDQIN